MAAFWAELHRYLPNASNLVILSPVATDAPSAVASFELPHAVSGKLQLQETGYHLSTAA